MQWHRWNKWCRCLTAVSGCKVSEQSVYWKRRGLQISAHRVWWAVWRLQTLSPSSVRWWRPQVQPVVYFSVLSWGAHSPHHSTVLALLTSSLNLGLSFTLLGCFCIPLSLKSILSNQRATTCTLDVFTQQQEPQRCKLQTALCPSVSLWLAAGCLLLVFVLVLNVFLLLLCTLSCFVTIIWHLLSPKPGFMLSSGRAHSFFLCLTRTKSKKLCL